MAEAAVSSTLSLVERGVSVEVSGFVMVSLLDDGCSQW